MRLRRIKTTGTGYQLMGSLYILPILTEEQHIVNNTVILNIEGSYLVEKNRLILIIAAEYIYFRLKLQYTQLHKYKETHTNLR